MEFMCGGGEVVREMLNKHTENISTNTTLFVG